uniref:Uncharacterized protein n=1 Tax=Rhizophora mucronata TaxID=61149 RepID=A0A2P2NWE2_RHIMU
MQLLYCFSSKIGCHSGTNTPSSYLRTQISYVLFFQRKNMINSVKRTQPAKYQPPGIG